MCEAYFDARFELLETNPISLIFIYIYIYNKISLINSYFINLYLVLLFIYLIIIYFYFHLYSKC